MAEDCADVGGGEIHRGGWELLEDFEAVRGDRRPSLCPRPHPHYPHLQGRLLPPKPWARRGEELRVLRLGGTESEGGRDIRAARLRGRAFRNSGDLGKHPRLPSGPGRGGLSGIYVNLRGCNYLGCCLHRKENHLLCFLPVFFSVRF